MKRFLVFLAAISMAYTGLTQASARTIDTKITDVTVFLNGAQVTESGTINLKEGENLIRLTDLTLYMDPNSIQAEGNSAYTIMSVRHQINYMVDQKSNPAVKALQDSLEAAQFHAAELQALKATVQQEKVLLEYNRTIKGDNAVLLSEDLKDMADFFRSRFRELEYKWLELSESERKNNLEINRLQNALNQLNQRKGTNPSEILISLLSQKAGNASIKVSYFVQNAGWYPVYDLRAEDINSPIEFAYRAKVFQSTGNDWEKVNLTISTGNPSVGGQLPVLYPWYLNLYDPQPVVMYDKRARRDYEASEAPAAAYGGGGQAQSEMYFDAIPNTAAGYTTQVSNTVNTEFKISVPYDIPSDNQQYDVTMQTQTLKAEYAYVTIPKLDNDAFLRAQIMDWAQYSLLPGESNIFFKGTYVGKGFIDPAMANDTLTLSLGRDRGISVKREQIKDYCKTSFFGGKQKTSKAYEITVQNNKKQAVTLQIEDQLPISQNGDIEVEREELSGAQVDEQTGKLVWKLTLQPGETVKKQLRFSVQYPKKRYVTGL